LGRPVRARNLTYRALQERPEARSGRKIRQPPEISVRRPRRMDPQATFTFKSYKEGLQQIRKWVEGAQTCGWSNPYPGDSRLHGVRHSQLEGKGKGHEPLLTNGFAPRFRVWRDRADRRGHGTGLDRHDEHTRRMLGALAALVRRVGRVRHGVERRRH